MHIDLIRPPCNTSRWPTLSQSSNVYTIAVLRRFIRRQASFRPQACAQRYPQPRGPCLRAGPPSPRPSPSASEVARSRLRGLPHAPESQPGFTARFLVSVVSHTRPNHSPVSLQRPVCRGPVPRLRTTPCTNMLLLITAVGPPAVFASLKPLNYIIHTGPNTSIRTCSAIHHGWLCVPCVIADDEGSGLFLSLSYCYSQWSYVYYTGRNTYVPAVRDHSPCMVGCVCPVEWRMTKRVVFYCFDHYEQKCSY